MTRRDLHQFLDRLKQVPGWSVVHTRSGHLQIRGPGGALVHTGSTPSDRRALRNLRSDLRRRGAPV
jgi:hypothetical protein